MNRPEKRRQRKLSEKAANNTKPVQSESSPPEQQTLTVQHAIDRALRHHSAGRLPEAGRIYQQILQAQPHQPVALHLLGVIAHQRGKNEIAVDLISKALAAKPEFAEAHSNLGAVFQDLGKLDEAAASYHKALAIKPDFAEVHYNLGNVLRSLGSLDEAVAAYEKALTLRPDYGEAMNNLGSAFRYLGRLHEAQAGVAGASAPGLAEAAGFDDYLAYNGGLGLSYAGFTVAGSFAVVDEGRAFATGAAPNSNEGRSFNVGGSCSTGPWAVSLTYFNGQEEGPTLTPGDEENEFIAAAVSYQLGPGIKTSLTFITAEMQDDSPAGANIGGNDTDGRAVLLGIHAGF